MKHYFTPIVLATTTSIASVAASARSPSEYSDLEIAHVAYTADSIDIGHAHLALAVSSNPVIHKFG